MDESELRIVRSSDENYREFFTCGILQGGQNDRRLQREDEVLVAGGRV
jgi:hypothetical protein